MPDMEKIAALGKMASDIDNINLIADSLLQYAQEEYAGDLIKQAGYNPEEVTTAEDLIYQAGNLLKLAAEMKAEEFVANTKEAADEDPKEEEEEDADEKKEEKKEEEKEEKEEKEEEEKEEKTAGLKTNAPFLNALISSKK